MLAVNTRNGMPGSKVDLVVHMMPTFSILFVLGFFEIARMTQDLSQKEDTFSACNSE
jgi:hypothetical protein